MDDDDARLLSLAASGRWPAFSWLDGGGEERGFLGLEPELEIESDQLDALVAVERLWRDDPSRVWIGWLTYDLGAAELLGRAHTRGVLAGLCMRRFAAALELRPGAPPRAHGGAEAIVRLQTALADAEPFDCGTEWPLSGLEPELDAAAYRARVARAQAHIVAGDTYQVNLSQRLHADWRSAGSIASAAARVYGQLRSATPAGMGGLIAAGSAWIVSNSPETLVDVRLGDGPAAQDVARSWPIKGTRPRNREPALDDMAARALRASTKDLAEHVMIVDLVRSDLGRLAVPGSVVAPTVPSLVSLPTVHHLVTQVSCHLQPGWSIRELADAMFPGGSVTGAPKRRTVEIIQALEQAPREIYCGAIVVLEPTGLRMSIPIRTGILDAGGLSLRSGGGIVIDSDAEEERQETLVKARAFDPDRMSVC